MTWTLIVAALLSASGGAGADDRAGAVSAAQKALGLGHRAFHAGAYEDAARVLEPLADRLPLARDYVLYLSAESQFYAGAASRAQAGFALVARIKTSRFADVAAWRVADCLWASGDKRAAVAAYRALLKQPPANKAASQRARKGANKAASKGGSPVSTFIDPVVARFRLAEAAAGAEAGRMFWAIHLEFPVHPLADEAGRRAQALRQPTGRMTETEKPGGGPASADSPRDRCKRAALLSEGKHYQEAHDELDKLPQDLPADLKAERDYLLGMAKYRMRRQYGVAAGLLLGVVGAFTGEKAAFAAFHGARALSRADQDDEAIAGYHRVVEKFPRSRWAAEAQFLSGWLDFNRGRYRESLPGLQATLQNFAKSPFAEDAAWYVAFAHFLLGEAQPAASALERYARIAHGDKGDSESAQRVLYWQARIAALAGENQQARVRLLQCAGRWPFSFYGLLARARLKVAGENPEISWPVRLQTGTSPKNGVARDPAVLRADQLLAAGMLDEAGVELSRAEVGLLKRYGQDQALALLLDRYPRMHGFRRAYQLAEVRGGRALASAPEGAARAIWEAAYPMAYREWVDAYGPKAGNVDLFLYAIMRKESGFSPHDVSYADARGLLQMIPTTSQTIAQREGWDFYADQLYEPETNVRLGATYIGSLYKKFREQLPLTAGAYNAGAGAMMRWCSQHGTHPMDEFVELIAFEQTRDYVKRVSGIYARYSYLYKKSLWELPLTVDAAYVQQGSPLP